MCPRQAEGYTNNQVHILFCSGYGVDCIWDCNCSVDRFRNRSCYSKISALIVPFLSQNLLGNPQFVRVLYRHHSSGSYAWIIQAIMPNLQSAPAGKSLKNNNFAVWYMVCINTVARRWMEHLRTFNHAPPLLRIDRFKLSQTTQEGYLTVLNVWRENALQKNWNRIVDALPWHFSSFGVLFDCVCPSASTQRSFFSITFSRNYFYNWWPQNSVFRHDGRKADTAGDWQQRSEPWISLLSCPIQKSQLERSGRWQSCYLCPD